MSRLEDLRCWVHYMHSCNLMYVLFRILGPSARSIQCQLCRSRKPCMLETQACRSRAAQWQGSEHDSLAAAWRYTVTQWGEGVIPTIMPSCDGGRPQRYRAWGDNGLNMARNCAVIPFS